MPYLHSNVPIDYEARYNVQNKEGKVVTTVADIKVTFGLVYKDKPDVTEETSYQAGSWKDEGVDKIIDEHEKVDS